MRRLQRLRSLRQAARQRGQASVVSWMLGPCPALLLRSPRSCTQRSWLDPDSDRSPLRNREKITPSRGWPSVARGLSDQSEQAHLQTNPSGPATLVHHPTLPAKELDG